MSYGTCDNCGSEDCEGYDACTIRSLRARVAELERERDAARAAVERLRADLNYCERERDRLMVDNERLREALLARCPRHCEADHEAGVCELTRREVAALAGAPSATRREDPVRELGEALDAVPGAAENMKARLLRHQDRALAERVRERIRHELYGRFPDSQRDEFIVALDLDALLEG